MATKQNVVRAGDFRVWIQENGPGPANAPEYIGCWVPGDSEWSFGETERIECPDPESYSQFVDVGEFQGAEERPTTSFQARYTTDLSDMLRIGRKRCALNVYVFTGKCRNPQDWEDGWDKIKIYPDFKISSWSDENAGAIESGDQNPTNESIEGNAREIIELVELKYDLSGGAVLTNAIRAIEICDSADCGDCGTPTDGCQRVFVFQDGLPGTPATVPSVGYSLDGGATWYLSIINNMTAGNDISGGACVGGNLVGISNDEDALMYAPLSDFLASGAPVWTEVTDGIDASGSPNAIYSADVSSTWIAGDGGYIYFTANPTQGVAVQEDGTVTAENLNAIHGQGASILVAGGDNGAILYSLNGGSTWTLANAPTGAPNVNAVYVLDEFTWLAGTAAGLFYTTDQGQTWTQITLAGTISNIAAIDFYDDSIGYLVGDNGGGTSFLFRTWNGGETWVLEPRSGSLPGAANTLNAVAACTADPNLVFAGGDDGADGAVLVKGA